VKYEKNINFIYCILKWKYGISPILITVITNSTTPKTDFHTVWFAMYCTVLHCCTYISESNKA
jgi:uncharacterized membrane protein